MEPQTGAHQQRVRGSDGQVSPPDAARSAVPVELSEEQRQVLDCLQEAATGLTTRQLESRLSRNRDSLDGVLSELMERQLVSRLNTLIPSYAYRRAGSRADTE